MTKKQTAVEWLMENLHTSPDPFAKAKAMEKEQHKETWFDSTLQFDKSAEMTNKKLFDDYYKETYES